MARTLAGLVADARAWLTAARDARWLADRPLTQLDAVERATPADLFREPAARPLVVALFGGTGVGKSSLLNRVAGQMLARTGVERPTSHEVTLYLHESVALADLPAELPVDTVHVARHASDAFRDVAWLDMPDIDSVAETNRATALAWLPFVDLVCYVVSPERYRDDRGWRVLLDRRQRHGWLFVMNRWDEGHADQAADFIRLLNTAGFDQPTVLRTCCRVADRGPAPILPSPDEFERLPATIRPLASTSTSQFSLAAELARIRDVRGVLSAALARFGDETIWPRARAAIQRRWLESSRTIATGLEYSIRAAAAHFSDHDAQVWRAALAEALGRKPAAVGATVKENAGAHLAPRIWDEWAGAKLAACFDAVEVDVAKLGVAPRPLRGALDATAADAAAVVSRYAGDGLRAALALPGTALTRAARRLTGFLMTFLPFLALVWIAFGVVRGFYAGVHEGRPFLGLEFAINSLLLVAVAWALPFALDRWLRPSLRASAERGLRAGIAAGLEAVGAVLLHAADSTAADAQSHRERGAALLRACDERLATSLAPEAAAVVARVA
jgi:hypothetical protein